MKKYFLSIFCGSAVGTLAFLLLTFYLANNNPVKQGIISAHGYILNTVKVNQTTPDDIANLNGLMKKGYILTTNDLITDVTSFYSGLIQILVVIIAVFGVVAFMYVKGQSEAAASKMAMAAVDIHLNSKAFHDGMESIANKHFKPMKESLDVDIQDLSERVFKIDSIEDLDRRIRTVEEKISKSDSDEMENSAGELS